MGTNPHQKHGIRYSVCWGGGGVVERKEIPLLCLLDSQYGVLPTVL